MKLQKAIEKYLAKEGSHGIEKLANRSRTSTATVSRARCGHRIMPSTAFDLALACNVSEEMAGQIADQYTKKRSKK